MPRPWSNRRVHRRVLLCCSLSFACIPTSSEQTSSDAESGGNPSGDPETDASMDTTSAQSSNCEPTTPGVHAAVFAEHCDVPGCHGGNQPAVGLDLSNEATLESSLVGRASACDGSPLIVAGDPEASLLWQKLAGTQSCGDAMPIGAPIDDALVDCVAQWITGVTSSCEQCGGTTCIDTTSNAAHCGGCELPCPGGVQCVDGECACPEGTMLCADACVDVASNAAHCGGCDQPCDMFCLMGECAADCGTLQACGGACVDTVSNDQHCGGCDQPCAAGASCTEGSCVCTADPVSFAAVVEPLLADNCTAMGCHGFPIPQLGLDLRAGNSYAALVGVVADQCDGRLLVTPGDAGNSYLVNKLRGVDLCSGTQMPKAGVSLPAADIDAIEAWICHGALEN
jgi:hypothetical protein